MNINNLLEPQALLLLIPLGALLAFFTFKDFVRDDFRDKREKRNFRILVFAVRIIILSLLVIVLAKPFGEVTITTPGNPKVTILVDASDSMRVMDTSFLQGLIEELETEFPVLVKEVGRPQRSGLGDDLLGYLEKDTNLLLVSDGRSNFGASLGEVALLAANLNSTISALRIEAKEAEVGVYVEGPDIIVSGSNATFKAVVTNLKGQEARLRLIIDGQEELNQVIKDDEYSFQKEFSQGDHRIVARVDSNLDYFANNNEFYKSVSVVKKPNVLLVQNTQDPLEQLLRELYDVTKASSIPENINDYYAIILNDMPASIQGVERLADYLIDKQGNYYGNGLLAIGGFDSFDRGSYKGSLLESYLPVVVGKAARQRGSSNIAISIDFSGTTGKVYVVEQDPVTGKVKGLTEQASNVQDVNKALAVSIIKSLGPDNSVGVSIFNTQSATVSGLAPLFKTRDELIDKVSRIQQPAGQSYFHIGLSGAYLLLKDNVGSNNIIMITDGQTGNQEIRKATIDAAKTLNSRGVKVYVVGTGRNVDEKFLADVANNGGGIYFPASQANNLKILFGEPEDSKFGEVFDLFILNPYHFITQGLKLDASLYGYNQVIPRASSLTLVTTQHGEPALTIWNYGFGRSAALNVFSGNNNLGDLLKKHNSILVSRSVNWAIGDPQRKEEYYVSVENARLNEPASVIVKSSKFPSAEGLTLSKVGESHYKASILPQQAGFSQVIGKEYAVNYQEEYQKLGLDQRLEATIASSGGRLFSPGEKDEIVKFVKSVSKRTRTEKTTIVWPFLLAGASLFIIEILLRRLREQRLNN